MSYFLPQNDPDPQARAARLASSRSRYEYSYDYVSPLALVKEVPSREKFSFMWWLKVLGRVRDVIKNEWRLADEPEHKKELSKLNDLSLVMSMRKRSAMESVTQLTYRMTQAYRRTHANPNLENYTELFQKIGLPPIHKDFQDDEVFAYMRLAGPNPVLLQRLQHELDHFPVTEQIFQRVMPDDSLEAAREEGRLYLVDYAGLEAIENGTVDGIQKFLYAPLALFAVDKSSKKLMPIAIQCEQLPGEDNPILTPQDDAYNWLIAKTIVSVADGNYHEAITHLGRTHFFVEPFVLATRRQLAGNHPLSRLLRPHFHGTLAINFAAHDTLIADGGGVDKLASGTIETTRKAAVDGVLSYRVDEAMLNFGFHNRGVDDTDVLPLYPYRDDSLLYWNAIERWVSSYLKIWYHTHEDLTGDQELQAWYQELRSDEGGRVPGLRDGELDLPYLVELLTLVIFTASVQHAAVNFPQYDLMSYAPNMPLACYAERPRGRSGATEEDYLNMLPPMGQAKLQLNLGYILGKVHYTQLGRYSWCHFRDGRVRAPLRTFQNEIREVDTRIRERNLERRAYEFLLASGIPQSINI